MVSPLKTSMYVGACPTAYRETEVTRRWERYYCAYCAHAYELS